MTKIKYLLLLVIICSLNSIAAQAATRGKDSITKDRKHYAGVATINSFTASYNQSKTVVNLHWVTSGKVTKERYIIERSIDSLHYEVIGETTSVSASNASQHYYFDDPHPISGKVFYRLHLIDANNKDFYSSPVSVFKEISSLEVDDAHIGPNGMEISVGMVAPNSAAANVLISDVNGDVLKTENFALKKGANYRTVYIGELKKGIYFLQINDKTNQLSRMQKFIKN